MKKKVVWLVVTGWMVAALLLASCAPAAVKEEEKKVTPPPEKKEEVVAPKKEVVAPKEEANTVKWTGKKLDGTVVEKMIEKPKYGGIHIRAADSQPTAWDDNVLSYTNNWGMHPVLESLVGPRFTQGPLGTGENEMVRGSDLPTAEWYEGWLAESWEIPDGNTLIYHIRKGVRWQDKPPLNGREMTADDVVYSWRRHYTTGYASRSYPYISDLKNPENSIYLSPTDKWAVVIKTNPDLPGMNAWLFNHQEWQRIMPPEVFGDWRKGNITLNTDWKKAVGTGPFMLTDYVGASTLTYVRNPNHWDFDDFFPENRLPYLDTFKIVIIPDWSTRLAGLRSGKIDMLYDVSTEDSRSLMKTNPELKWRQYLTASSLAIYPRNNVKPFDDVRVRQALMLGINFRELADVFYEGEAVLFHHPVPPLSTFAKEFVPLEKLPESVKELYSYKPEKARQLLAEAGYPQGFKTEIVVWSSEQIDMAAILKEYWAKVGIDLKIDVRDFSVYTQLTRAFTFPQMMMGGRGSHFVYSFQDMRPDSGFNYSRDMNPVNMPMFREGQKRFFQPEERYKTFTEPMSKLLPDIPEAREMNHSWAVHMNEGAYYIALPLPYQYSLWQPWLKNYESGHTAGPWDTGFRYAKIVWIDQELKKAMGR